MSGGRALRAAGTGLLFLVVAALLTVVCAPPFLDRADYRGPPSDHFDGRRFFNPEDGPSPAQPRAPSSAPRMTRFLLGGERARWPDHVAVAQGYPPAAATPCAPLAPAVVREAWRRCVDRVDPARMFVTWIGHATVLVQTQGLAILTDPVWSDYATPLPPFGPRRVRPPGIRFDDLPRIDLVLLSHDHYDHMDVATLRRLARRDHPVIVTSLGNDRILAANGVTGAVARDWGGHVAFGHGIDVIVERVHHWSTRWGADRNRALWSGFTVTLPGGNLFFAGDTGWGDGAWVRAAARHGPFRLALIPIGAFLPREIMQPNHIGPDEAVRVFRGLGAGYALGVHWGTFRLAAEPIDAPPRLLAATLKAEGIAPGRFRTLEAGQPWEVPSIPPTDLKRAPTTPRQP